MTTDPYLYAATYVSRGSPYNQQEGAVNIVMHLVQLLQSIAMQCKTVNNV